MNRNSFTHVKLTKSMGHVETHCKHLPNEIQFLDTGNLSQFIRKQVK